MSCNSLICPHGGAVSLCEGRMVVRTIRAEKKTDISFIHIFII